MKVSPWVKLLLALLLTVGTWLAGAVNFSDLSSPQQIGALLVQLAIVTASALGINLTGRNGNTQPGNRELPK